LCDRKKEDSCDRFLITFHFSVCLSRSNPAMLHTSLEQQRAHGDPMEAPGILYMVCLTVDEAILQEKSRKTARNICPWPTFVCMFAR
jgi:hypothetical protein